MNAQNLVVEYLDRARQMQIATSVDNQPWVATVYFAHDNAHNLYWISMPDTRHSQEIARNPNVAGTIVVDNTPGQPVRGIQFTGVAREIPNTEVKANIEAYAERFQRFTLGDEIANGVSPIKLYQIKPHSFVLFDQKNFPSQPRQEWVIDKS